MIKKPKSLYFLDRDKKKPALIRLHVSECLSAPLTFAYAYNMLSVKIWPGKVTSHPGGVGYCPL